MKICIVIIYSYSELYVKMKKALHKYYSSKDISFYFVEFNNTAGLIENTIYVKGEEHLLHILEKTIKSFDYILKNVDFDFIIRTNISTVIDIKNLRTFLTNIPSTGIYCGGNKNKLSWLDYRSGIYDTTHFGTTFVQGTSIILSKDVVELMCKNSNEFNYNIVDDLSIGIFFKKYDTILQKSDPYNAKFIYVNNKSTNINEIIDKDAVFYRNVSDDRNTDADRIIVLTDYLEK